MVMVARSQRSHYIQGQHEMKWTVWFTAAALGQVVAIESSDLGNNRSASRMRMTPMATKTWTLIDIDKNLNERSFAITREQGGGSADYSIRKFAFEGGMRSGVEAVEIDNGRFRFIVVPTRGMGLWKAWLGQLELGWRSPVRGPVHPSFVNLYDPSGLGWLDGFDELLCRCGLESNGAPDFDSATNRLNYPLHGKIANRPAQHLELTVDSDRGEIRLTGIVDESRFHFQKLRLKSTIVTRFGEPGLLIRDEIANLSGVAAEAQLLYHVNFGQPLLDPGSAVVAAVKTVAPRNEHAAAAIANWQSYPNEQPGDAERVYFCDLYGAADSMTRVLLKNAHATQGVSLGFSVKELPCFSVWKNTPASQDGYVTGIEPATNFPNPRSFEKQHGRVVALAPGESATYSLSLTAHDTAADIKAAEAAVRQLQSHPAEVFSSPKSDWSKL